jgi:hypothetical protein
MTLAEVCAKLVRLDDDGVIYARRVGGKFVPDSEAVVLKLSEDETSMPARYVEARRCPGLSYCLEVFIAKEAAEVWSTWRDGARANAEQVAEAVCYKANNDAWGPPSFPAGGGAEGTSGRSSE